MSPMAANQEKREKVGESTWRLNSPAASDLKWFFRQSGAELGFHAMAIVPLAETVRERPTSEPALTKICRACCRVVAVLAPECPECRGKRFKPSRREPDQLMAVRGSKRGASNATTDKRDEVIVAVPKERRIREGLERVSPEAYQVLACAYGGKSWTPEMRSVLGVHCDLAMRLERCQKAYERYLVEWNKRRPPEKLDADLWPVTHHPPLAARTARRSGIDIREPDTSEPLQIDVWLTRECREKGKGDLALRLMREDAELLLCEALAEYAAVRIQPSDEESVGKAREVCKPKEVDFLFGGDK